MPDGAEMVCGKNHGTIRLTAMAKSETGLTRHDGGDKMEAPEDCNRTLWLPENHRDLYAAIQTADTSEVVVSTEERWVVWKVRTIAPENTRARSEDRGISPDSAGCSV